MRLVALTPASALQGRASVSAAAQGVASTETVTFFAWKSLTSFLKGYNN